MASFVYVDNSNVFIEGKFVSAVEKGLALNIWDAHKALIQDYGYALDFGRLYDFSGATRDGCANLYGSRPPPNDSLWKIAEKAGFKTVVYDRSVYTNTEKKVDTSIVKDMIRDAYTKIDKLKDEIVLIAGDSDFAPAVEDLVKDGFKVYVVFWAHAATDLKKVCTKFTSLDPHLRHLAY
ncbi:NYN domain-containing protein [Myxococcus sp. AS-1-15]|uniref:NYN domain-containing protein n=1 Tax=Myxococcus sp. AS-1-15 TaxID=2874600 RepID=UPI001CBBF161|nr:NYN domain-containing protein [Myxococcus sp. AS-1-15]MBZ4396733.1 NYN domain-containing protein [Myxococcus sp. AS-1-15]